MRSRAVGVRVRTEAGMGCKDGGAMGVGCWGVWGRGVGVKMGNLEIDVFWLHLVIEPNVEPCTELPATKIRSQNRKPKNQYVLA